MLNFYTNASAATGMRTVVGSLVGNGTSQSFVCASTPAQVRLFNNGQKWGKLLVTPGNYTLADLTISIATVPSVGTNIFAVGAGQYLFENLHVPSNAVAAADRTMAQKLYVKSEDANATDVTIYIENTMATSITTPINITDHYLAQNVAGSPGSYGSAGASLALGSLAATIATAFWVKVIVPYGTPMDNYHNITIKSTSENFSVHL